LQITQLRDLDLEFTFESVRALRENIENQLAAIDHADLELVLEIARLRGRERVVENRERCALGLRKLTDLRGLALTDEGARVRLLQALVNDSGDFGAGALGQCVEFFERFFGADPLLRTELDSDQDGALVMFVGDVVRFRQILTSSRGGLAFEHIRKLLLFDTNPILAGRLDNRCPADATSIRRSRGGGFVPGRRGRCRLG